MRSAVEQKKLRQRRKRLFELLTERRAERPSATGARIRAVRTRGRP